MEKEQMGNKKKNFDYFQAYFIVSDIACEAASMLKTAVRDLSGIEKAKVDIHSIENRADGIHHELVNALNRAFITPIESEDLKYLGQAVDDVVDAIEDVVCNFYILNVRKIREEAVEFADLIFKCCEALKNMMEEFPNYKKSKTLSKYIVAINALEEEGDRLYQKAIRRLFSETADASHLIKWLRIFELMEKCCDSCEDVADMIESTILKNT